MTMLKGVVDSWELDMSTRSLIMRCCSVAVSKIST